MRSLAGNTPYALFLDRISADTEGEAVTLEPSEGEAALLVTASRIEGATDLTVTLQTTGPDLPWADLCTLTPDENGDINAIVGIRGDLFGNEVKALCAVTDSTYDVAVVLLARSKYQTASAAVQGNPGSTAPAAGRPAGEAALALWQTSASVSAVYTVGVAVSASIGMGNLGEGESVAVEVITDVAFAPYNDALPGSLVLSGAGALTGTPLVGEIGDTSHTFKITHSGGWVTYLQAVITIAAAP
ncbi:MAG TPA: hypothetical protein VIV56_16910 [Gemmatimonadales bacterium]